MKLPALRPLSTAPQACKICGGAAPLFGVVDFNSRPINVEFGLGFGLNAATDRLTLKLILSRDL